MSAAAVLGPASAPTVAHAIATTAVLKARLFTVSPPLGPPDFPIIGEPPFPNRTQTQASRDPCTGAANRSSPALTSASQQRIGLASAPGYGRLALPVGAVSAHGQAPERPQAGRSAH